MIEIKKLTPTLSEIYSGGGNWLTQSAPTNFHQFYRRRQLLAGESVADWREVTDAEKATLEAQDAKWVEPSQDLIDRWNAACVWFPYEVKSERIGQYNESTGFFELSDIKDLTTQDAVAVLDAGQAMTDGGDSYLAYNKLIRTNLPPRGMNASTGRFLAYYATSLEVLNAQRITLNNFSLFGCGKLHTIYCWGFSTKPQSANIPKLRKLRFSAAHYKLSLDLEFANCPYLEADTIEHILSHCDGNAHTLTLHPDVMERILEESNEEWHALLEAAAAKNVTLATA